MMKIKLVGCKRYNEKGELFLTGETYMLDDDRAKYLLSQTDYQTGWPYFELDTSDNVGVKPGLPEEDNARAPRSERPRNTERAPRAERPGRRPREASQATPGKQSAPIEDADAVTV